MIVTVGKFTRRSWVHEMHPLIPLYMGFDRYNSIYGYRGEDVRQRGLSVKV